MIEILNRNVVNSWWRFDKLYRSYRKSYPFLVLTWLVNISWRCYDRQSNKPFCSWLWIRIWTCGLSQYSEKTFWARTRTRTNHKLNPYMASTRHRRLNRHYCSNHCEPSPLPLFKECLSAIRFWFSWGRRNNLPSKIYLCLVANDN